MNEEGKIFTGPRPYQPNANTVRGRSVRYPQQQSKQRRWIFKFSLGILLICALIYGWLKLSNPDTLPIHNVKITGTYTHINQNALRETIMPFVQKGFLGTDTTSLQDRLQQLPWVYSATVQRIWPDTLTIALTEQQAIARFNTNTLLNPYGELFTVDPSTMSTDLPLFIAAPGQQVLLWHTYQQFTAIVAQLGLKITILGLDARQSWRLQLSNGLILLLGKVDPAQRLARFVTIYPQAIANKSAAVNYVDLRYTNGMAVGLKNQNMATN